MGDDRTAALAAPHPQQALGLEDAESFAQARAADGELLEQHGFGRQLRAVGEITVEDPGP